MLNSRLFWKLFGILVALVLATTAISMLMVERRIEADERAGVELALAQRASLLHDMSQDALTRRDFGPLRRRVPELGRECGARLTVIDADGKVLADSEEDPERMDSHLDRPEIQAALASGVGRAQRYSRTLGTSLIYHALAVRSGTGVVGYVRVSVPLSELEARLDRMRLLVLTGGGVGVLICFVAAWFLAQRLGARLCEMIDLTGAVGRGDYSVSVDPSGSDELGELGRALNGMCRELKTRTDTIVSDRNKFIAILGSMVEGVVAVDRDDRVVHMNEVAGRLLRAAPSESVGKRIWEVTRLVEVSEILDQARRTHGETDAEVRLAQANGEARIELRATPLLDGAGQVAGAVVVLHDVTELRRLEGMRRDFVANVSHELKTPLTAIRALVETLIEDRDMESPTRERFHVKIRDQTARLSSLVADLLTLARIESQAAPRERRPMDVRAVVRECAASLAPSAQKGGITLAVHAAAEPVVVEADEESLRQIVDNLLDNALKYTPSGGRIEIRALASEREARIEVADTGIGIEPRDLERIFERFYRVDKARSREVGGTGLGLSIVKHLTISLGGGVSVESQVGKGSTFRVTLPLRGP
ncbi:MAG: PAS domain-containing protein [Planctomycetes bacterium]|nr:PAS domain-containing protein [Planctomycetota bacterium]